MAKMSWRLIAECPPTLRRAVLFVPDGARWIGGIHVVDDERVVAADRHDDGTWWVDSYQGGYNVEPTHFLNPGVPDGFPDTVDPEPLRLEAEALRAEREKIWRQVKADRSRTAAEAASLTPEREREMEAEREAYWSDPENLRRSLSGED